MTLTDRPASPSNYGSRHGRAIDMIVLHTTEPARSAPPERAAGSAADWFASPVAHASAHYVVGQDGAIVRCVPDEFAAWHAGNASMNCRSLGVELAGRCEDPGMFTPALMAALAELCLELAALHRIPLDRLHIIGHNEVPDPLNPSRKGGAHHHIDPGPHFPWPALLARLRPIV